MTTGMPGDKPTELDFTGAAGQDPALMDLARRRAMANALLQRTMAAQGGNFKKHPLAALADAIAIMKGKDQIKSVNAEEAAAFQATKERDKQELSSLLNAVADDGKPLHGPTLDGTPLEPLDARQTILQALTSGSKNVSGVAKELWKTRGDTYNTVVKEGLGKGLDLQTVLDSAGTQNVRQLKKMNLQGPQVKSAGEGNDLVRWLETQNPNGGITATPLRGNTNISASATNASNKPGFEALEQSAKYYLPGGKGHEEWTNLHKRLNDVQNILQTMGSDPQMGTGAGLFQQARKLAETLGLPASKITSPTELMQMQLGQAVYNELGTLGAQVSDADRQFMIDSQGSLSTDPTALRRLLLLRARYLMQVMAKRNEETKWLRENPSMTNAGIQFPDMTYKFNPGQAAADELELLFSNQGNPPPMQNPRLRNPNQGSAPPAAGRIRPKGGGATGSF